MKRFQRILVPLSLEDSDLNLFYWTHRVMGLSQGTEIVFIASIPELQYGEETLVEVLPPAEDLLANFSERMEKWVSDNFTPLDDVEVRCRCMLGNPDRVLLTELAENDYDLTILGVNSPAQRQLGEKIARKSPTSTLLVPAGASRELQRILVPTDLSSYSAYALEVAQAFARAFHIDQINVLHVYSVPRDYSLLSEKEFREFYIDAATKQFDRFIAENEAEDVKSYAILREDNFPFFAVSSELHDEFYDMVVLASRGKSGFTETLLGSNSAEIVRRSQVLTLIVKQKGSGVGILRALLGMGGR